MAEYEAESWREPAFVQEHISQEEFGGPGAKVTSAKVEVWDGSGGASGAEMFHLTVEFTSAQSEGVQSKAYVLKVTPPSKRASAKAMGQSREGVFLQEFETGSAKTPALVALKPKMARIAFARGDMDSGRKVIVMEKVSGVQSGYFFQAHSPLNWGKDIAALTKEFPDVTELAVTVAAFEAGALLHARYWNDPSILEPSMGSHLRAREWHRREGEATWQSTMDQSGAMWKAIRPAITEGGTWQKDAADAESKVVWGDALTALLDASWGKASFKAYTEEDIPSRGHCTMVHGDFHPGNMIVRRSDPADPKSPWGLVLVDWEVVGVGSGPQDLGQYMISHSTPTARRANYKPALAAYTKTLWGAFTDEQRAAHFGNDASKAEAIVEREYVLGGLGRWMWFLPLLAQMCPPKMTQYFVDQVAAFLEDHPMTAATIPMPRA